MESFPYQFYSISSELDIEHLNNGDVFISNKWTSVTSESFFFEQQLM